MGRDPKGIFARAIFVVLLSAALLWAVFWFARK